MKYWYPKFDGMNLGLFRVGGPGLGNLLFVWARAQRHQIVHGGTVIAPTWPQIKVGPILRMEPDKRFYGGLFRPLEGEVKGLRALNLLRTCARFPETEAVEHTDPAIHVVEGMAGKFSLLLQHHAEISQRFAAMLANKPAENELQARRTEIAVHVRLGDFKAAGTSPTAATNTRTPITWYVEALARVRAELGEDHPARIFSDGADDELAPLLRLPHVRRHLSISAPGDILNISRSRVLIASGSTFSMWAGYLGKLPSIWHPMQHTQQTTQDPNREIELPIGEDLPETFKNIIRRRAD